ncbi:GATA transcription factor 5-like [Chenopodium quinoa]|uniref:GATA transcription factor n=1 Tax=Chenopodium quinoa TaxID=63459 RepID=A0A803LPD5_CHEQI|nr:GATA transcription factor 5-like [Chenopodium quinoa]
MECMKARALKSNFSSETAMKNNNPPNFFDDFWRISGLPTEDFSIDEFFDLPNEDNVNGSSLLEEEEEKDSSSFSRSSHDPVDHSNSNFSPSLAIPVDDVQELELWSHLMDDSIPSPTLACPKPSSENRKTKPGFTFMNRVEPVSKPGLTRVSCIASPSLVPVKPRSKRARTTVNRTWTFSSSPKTDSASSCSSTSSPVSTLLFPPPVQYMGLLYNNKRSMKKAKKKPSLASSEGENPLVQRKCSHCQVTKTPQWRAGPNGSKTLCNACGVRFKSGRLFPEYRPACSPTFSSEVHSNSHRKVLEMRKKKESTEAVTGLAQTVLSS